MRSPPGATTVSPSGLSMSDAIFATDLLVAAPTERVSLTSDATRAFKRAAIRLGVSTSDTEAVTSRNASSRESGSTTSAVSLKIDMT